MSIELINKIKQARRFEVSVGEVVFEGDLPSQEDIIIFSRDGITNAGLAKKCITGWRGVKELDCIEGGSDALVEYSKELFDLLIVDKPEWWQPIMDSMLAKLQDRNKTKEAQEKNSRSGSKAKASKG